MVPVEISKINLIKNESESEKAREKESERERERERQRVRAAGAEKLEQRGSIMSSWSTRMTRGGGKRKDHEGRRRTSFFLLARPY